MGKYVLQRLLLVIPVLLGATLLVFTIMNFAPGDPALILLGPTATEEQLAKTREEMGLNDPFFVRYGKYVLNLVQGDMGKSYRNNLDISTQIFERTENTMILAGSAVLFAVIVGVTVGIISAVKQYSKVDNIIMVVTLFLAASPVFWLGLMAILVFSLKLRWLPAAGMNSGFPDVLMTLILPAIVLSGNTLASIARTTRSSMLEVVRQDYIDTARAKGVKESNVVLRHMLPNAIIPIITLIGINFGSLLGGSVVTESIFAWPGVGRFVLDSINYKDTPSVLSSVVMLAVFATLVNFLVDILYAFVDPRIRSQYQSKRK